MKNKILYVGVVLALFVMIIGLSGGMGISSKAAAYSPEQDTKLECNLDTYKQLKKELIINYMDKSAELKAEVSKFYESKNAEILGERYNEICDIIKNNSEREVELSKNYINSEEYKTLKQKLDSLNEKYCISGDNDEKTSINEQIKSVYSQILDKFSNVNGEIKKIRKSNKDLFEEMENILNSNKEKLDEMYCEGNKLFNEKFCELSSDFYAELKLLNDTFEIKCGFFDLPPAFYSRNKICENQNQNIKLHTRPKINR